MSFFPDRQLILQAIGPLQVPSVEGDVGMNLPSNEEVLIPWQGYAQIRTGIHVELPKGTWGLILPRSSCNGSGSLIALPGVIDNGYRGELTAMVHNVKRPPFAACLWLLWHALVGSEAPDAYRGVRVRVGQSLAQLVLLPSLVPWVLPTTELSSSARGKNGYGSSGNGVQVRGAERSR